MHIIQGDNGRKTPGVVFNTWCLVKFQYIFNFIIETYHLRNTFILLEFGSGLENDDVVIFYEDVRVMIYLAK